MTLDHITEYEPPDDVVQISPNAIDFFYAKPHGIELIGMMLTDPNLGAFAIMLRPKFASHLVTSLTTMARELTNLREAHDERFGQP